VKPVEIGGSYACLKEDGGAPSALFEEIELASIANLDTATWRGEAAAIAMRADELVEESNGEEDHGHGDNREDNIHG
jgi:hypothetical protein